MEEERIDLTQLALEWEPNHQDDTIDIFTRMGIHNPGKPMGHKCSLGSLSCSDTYNPSDCKYQMANLFIASPEGAQVPRNLR